MTQLSRESVCRSVVSCPKNNGKTKKKKVIGAVRVVCIVKSRKTLCTLRRKSRSGKCATIIRDCIVFSL